MMTSKKTTLAKMAAVMALTGFVGTIGSASVDAGEHAMGTDWGKLNWVTLGPLQVVPLWGDPKVEESAFFVKLRSGQKGRKHAHSKDYHGVTIQGTWLKTMGDESVKKIVAGSYIMQPKKAWHIDHCAGPEACIFFINFLGPRDVFFPVGASPGQGMPPSGNK
jgi:quercetin dioxygenase-like cupin family protein